MLKKIISLIERIILSAYSIFMLLLITSSCIVAISTYLLGFQRTAAVFLYAFLISVLLVIWFRKRIALLPHERAKSDTGNTRPSFGDGLFLTVPIGTITGLVLSCLFLSLGDSLSLPMSVMLLCTIAYPITAEILSPIAPDEIDW